MNLPNKLTLSRIFLVPVFMIFIIPLPEWFILLPALSGIKENLQSINNFIINIGNYIGAGIFIIAASTDKVDGYLARKNKQITRFGIFLDPIADKLMITAALLALLQRNDVSAWAAILIIGREFLVTGLRLVAAGEGIVLSAGSLGKIKLVMQTVAIAAALLKDYPFTLFTDIPFHRIAMFAAVIITVYSGYDYIRKNIKVIDIRNT